VAGGGANNRIQLLDIQAGKKIRVAGFVSNPKSYGVDFFAQRFDPNGKPDSSFANGGVLRHELGRVTTHSVGMDSTRKILVVSNKFSHPPPKQLDVLTFTKDGQVIQYR
jgi:hypothetical protein